MLYFWMILRLMNILLVRLVTTRVVIWVQLWYNCLHYSYLGTSYHRLIKIRNRQRNMSSGNDMGVLIICSNHFANTVRYCHASNSYWWLRHCKSIDFPDCISNGIITCIVTSIANVGLNSVIIIEYFIFFPITLWYNNISPL